MVWVMRVRAAFERLIPHLSACCAVGLDGEVAGRGVVFSSFRFSYVRRTSKANLYGEAAEFVEIRRSVLDGLTLPS